MNRTFAESKNEPSVATLMVSPLKLHGSDGDSVAINGSSDSAVTTTLHTSVTAMTVVTSTTVYNCCKIHLEWRTFKPCIQYFLDLVYTSCSHTMLKARCLN